MLIKLSQILKAVATSFVEFLEDTTAAMGRDCLLLTPRLKRFEIKLAATSED